MLLKHKLLFPVIIALIGVIVFFYYPDLIPKLYSTFSILTSCNFGSKEIAQTSTDESEKGATDGSNKNEGSRLFLPVELKKYDGSAGSRGLYLALLGEVFDVEKGAHHYKPGGGYSFFAGIDASRAYITGDFNENGLVDDLSGLNDASLLSIEDWLAFYTDEYPHVGKVVGRYYDKNGDPTLALEEVWESIERGRKNKWIEDREKEVFPPCNSQWTKETGSRVWCTNKSGGIDRQWVGVPRKLFKVGKDSRCVCVRDSGAPSGTPESADHANNGDLGHPNLQEFINCPSNSVSCMVYHP